VKRRSRQLDYPARERLTRVVASRRFEHRPDRSVRITRGPRMSPAGENLERWLPILLDNAILRRLRLLNSRWNPPVTLLSTAETNWTLMTSDSIRR